MRTPKSYCPVCLAEPNHRKPRMTGRMWGSPGADEPSHVEWCTGRVLVQAWPEERVTKRGKRKPHRQRRTWRQRRAAWQYRDEEPF